MNYQIKLSVGIEILHNILKTISSKTGVYQMYDHNNTVIYIGKAKNLQKRIIQYTHINRLNNRLQNLVSRIKDVKTIITNNEAEAFLLEANLIKKYRPKYNILLKDDKSYPYIHINTQHDYPAIELYRGKRNNKSKYYGPFTQASQVREILDLLQKTFLTRNCSDNEFKTRIRPCMKYQIKRCSAPCVGYVSQQEYQQQVENVHLFLQGKTNLIKEQLTKLMLKSSEEYEYEKAAFYRDKIQFINNITAKQSINLLQIGNADIIYIHTEADEYIIEVFFYRNGQNYGNKEYYPKQTEGLTKEEVLTNFIGQFYQTFTPPQQIFVNVELTEKKIIETALAAISNYKIQIIYPKLGDKKKLLDIAHKNAVESLNKKLNQKRSHYKFLQQIQNIFNLKKIPNKIEVYDNSHIQGQYSIGAMICVGLEGFEKHNYRRFNIKSSEGTPGDDCGMLREILTRRLSRLKLADSAQQINQDNMPQILLIDGGKGQFSVTEQVVTELGLTEELVFCCIAKGKERNKGNETFLTKNKFLNVNLDKNIGNDIFYSINTDKYGNTSFTFKPRHPLLYFFERIRDEAHRFAITSHRIKRAKSVNKSIIDDIANIGTVRKKLLLSYFGSSKRVQDATLEELTKVKGINKTIAQEIYNFLHSDSIS